MTTSPRTNRACRTDPKYAWVDEPRLTKWRHAFAEWTAQHSSLPGAIRSANAALSLLTQNPNLAGSPEEYCRRAHCSPLPLDHGPNRGPEGAALVTNGLHAFFEWFLATKLTTVDRFGVPLRSRQHWNPIVPKPIATRRDQTARDVLPPRILRALLDRLTRNDWEWAKTIEGDWAIVVDSNTGERARVWCPVRATALALKLMLPLRTFQVRVLESGEGDSERYIAGHWVPNSSAHAPPNGQPTVRRGFLRAFRNRFAGTLSTGFFVNTNKTSDRLPDEAETGYEMPWQHDRAIRVVEELERWQERFNPVAGALPWNAVHERELRLATHPRPGGAFFLMRDPNNQNEPVTDVRLNYLWRLLMGACEDELEARGERLPDGERIALTERVVVSNGKNMVTRRRSIYDLHSLRVSLLSALAIDGAVPLHVLSQCVAGHKSLVMTLYYVKTDPEEINKTLRQAELQIESDRSEFVRGLRSSVRQATGVVADAAGIAALDQSRASSWHVMDTGICPVGASRCGDGGPLIGKNRYGPVPGGRNCARCRFHITGPAFLPGLVARFNTISMRIERAREHLEVARESLEAAEDARFDAEQMKKTVDPATLALARERSEDALIALDSEVGTAQEIAILVERCLQSLRIRESGKPTLILNTEKSILDVEIRATRSVELWDSVCRAADVFPDPMVSEARVRRADAINRMLVKSGRAPILLVLEPDVALKVANDLVGLMTAQLGSDRAFEVIAGEHATLEASVQAIIERAVVGSIDGIPGPEGKLLEVSP